MLIISLAIVITVNHKKRVRDTELTEYLLGIWTYDESTKYEFDPNSKGGMYIGETKYSYVFTVNGDEIELDFNDPAVHDATYTFSVSGDKLKLVGGEGTVGGEYELQREK